MAAITLNSALPALTDIARLQQVSYLNGLALPELENMLGAASAAIRRYARRNFNVANYVGYFDGGSYPYDVFFLPEIPIISVSRLATGPQTVLTIQNTSTANQRATVAVTSTGLTLLRVASGVVTSDTTVTFAANVTVQAVANAVNALGNGWLATPVSGYALYPSADFKITQGAMSAFSTGASLQQYLENPTFNGSCSFIDGLSQGGLVNGWRLDESKGVIWGTGFTPGGLTVRCDWTGGFSEVPDDVQEACVLTAIAISRAKTINPSYDSERLGDAGYTRAKKMTSIPGSAQELLRNYVDWAASRV